MGKPLLCPNLTQTDGVGATHGAYFRSNADKICSRTSYRCISTHVSRFRRQSRYRTMQQREIVIRASRFSEAHTKLSSYNKYGQVRFHLSSSDGKTLLAQFHEIRQAVRKSITEAYARMQVPQGVGPLQCGAYCRSAGTTEAK
jgi:hypothetical protein